MFDSKISIQYKNIKELKLYDKNPRKNKDSVPYVANSIRQFGFKVPVVVDKNNVVVCGHTRIYACKQLDITEVPCIIADDLTDEQIKAYRLADNKVGELSEWDFDLLGEELDGILDLDVSDFGFDLSGDETEEQPEEEKENARLATNKAYNLDHFDRERTDGRYQMPTIEPVDYKPDDLVGFNYARTREDKNVGIHFFLDDYQFERIWNMPEKNLSIIREYDCMLTPDFSLYLDMPIAMKIWNVYRSRLIGQMAQDSGIIVIPTVQWAEPETFDFCFDGLPRKATLAISTIGVKTDPHALEIWQTGTKEMIKRLTPKRILIYGGKLDFDYGDIELVYYENHVTERMIGND